MIEAPNLTAACVHFGRLLRRAGLPVTSSQIATFVASLRLIDVRDRQQVRNAARATLVTYWEQAALFERAFDLFWSVDGCQGINEAERWSAKTSAGVHAGASASEAGDEAAADRSGSYSAAELLASKDFALLSPEESEELRRAILAMRWRTPQRRTRRMVASRQGRQVDLRRTLRAALCHGGEAMRLATREHRLRPRPVVVLCDVSGSMDRYSRMFLLFVYALVQQQQRPMRTEVFVFSTRLTRITRQLAQRDPEQALRAASAAATGWGGGTRMGEALRSFAKDWSRRVLRSGAVVLIMSDGCDRGEIELLAQEMERLQRSCYRLIWLNPLLSAPDYQPLARGMAASLPFVHHFLPVHNLVSLERLDQLLASLDRMAKETPRINTISGA